MTERAWPSLTYTERSATCDTLHAHTQVLGKLAVALAPPEPQLQHAALLLTARGSETLPLPAPDGAFVAGLDLRAHEAFLEHSDGRTRRVALQPNRAVGEVTRELLDAADVLGCRPAIDPTPQEVWWSVPLDEDDEHATYDAEAVSLYFAAATRAALVLAEFRSSYRGSTKTGFTTAFVLRGPLSRGWPLCLGVLALSVRSACRLGLEPAASAPYTPRGLEEAP
jgi:hypothetical protein